MADKEKWGQQLDKIAYAVAGVAGLLVLAVPFLFSGQPKDAESDEELGKLRDRIEGQPPRLAEEQRKGLQPESVREAIAKQWTVGEAAKGDPSWVTERQPLLVRKIPKPPPVAAVHNAGTITEIACTRDLEKKVPFLVVKGAVGEGSLNVVLKKVALLRKEGDGEFAPVNEFAEAYPPGKIEKAFEFKDYGVVPGKTYAYLLLSTAVRDPKAPKDVAALAAAEVEKRSEPLGPAAVPYDFKIDISSFEGPKGADQSPRVYTKLSYWDYKTGKAVDWKDGGPDYFQEGQKFGNDRYDFFRIDDLGRKVTIRDLESESTAKYEITGQESKLPRSVTCEEPVTPESLKAKADAAAAAEAEKQRLKEEADAKKAIKDSKKGKTSGKKPKSKDKAAKDKAAKEKTADKKPKAEESPKTKPASGEETGKKRF